MSRHDYPRMRDEPRPLPPTGKQCEHCNDAKATHVIVVQEDHMRGNDEVFQVCARGLQLATEGKWAALYGAIQNTKRAREAAA